MATSFSVSSTHLRKRIKQLTGNTLSQTLQNIRMEKAKELMLTTSYDLTAIIAEIGCLDVSSFIRKFRNETGPSPGKYRSEHLPSCAEAPSGEQDDPDTM